jgi:microcystin-dependent protein
MVANPNPAEQMSPVNHALARSVGGSVYGPANNLVSFNGATMPNAGGSQPHNNLQPFLAINFIIALVGLYPSRG